MFSASLCCQKCKHVVHHQCEHASTNVIKLHSVLDGKATQSRLNHSRFLLLVLQLEIYQ